MSSKTPKAASAKTALALRFAGLAAVALAAIIILRVTMPRSEVQNCQEIVTESVEVHVEGDAKRRVRIQADIASDQAERERGLSGRDCLVEDEGMLFLFQEPGNHCFWMKDMKFAIDMIWLDAEKKIIHVEPDVGPETYPTSFCPAKAAKYVLEVGSGKAARHGFDIGTRLEF